MFRNSQTILRILGIELKISSSWLLIAALVTWSLASQVFPDRIPGLADGQYLVLGFVAMLLLFASLVLHELAHATVARAFGIDVPRITLFLFGGVAELSEEPDTPVHEFWIAIAGPAMSFALSLAFWVLSYVSGLVLAGTTVPTLFSLLGTINLILAGFNLLPAFPLDGGRVLRAVLWARSGDVMRATETAAGTGAVLAYTLIALGVIGLFQGIVVGSAWQILIGFFILLAARTAVESQRIKSFLGSQTVSDVMSRRVVTAPPDLPLTDLVNRVMLPNRVSFVPVVEDEVLLGHIDAEVLSNIDRENWGNTQVGDVFVGLDDQTTISPRFMAADLLQRFAESRHRKLLVVEDHRLLGVVTLSDLTRYLGLLTELHLGRPLAALDRSPSATRGGAAFRNAAERRQPSSNQKEAGRS